MGAIEALITLDGEKAKEEFLQLAKDRPDDVSAKDYSYMGGQMASAAVWSPAIDVLDAGHKRFGKEEPTLEKLLDQIKIEAESNPEVMEKLKGLGYT